MSALLARLAPPLLALLLAALPLTARQTVPQAAQESIPPEAAALLVPASPVRAQDKKAGKRTYTYKTVGACEIKADVYGMSEGKAWPAVLWIHGGALIVGLRGQIDPIPLRKLLDAGYAVVSIDYRLAPETKLPAILDDVQDAYRWVREKGQGRFNIDPQRIAVMGRSAGGYLTLTTGYRVRPPLPHWYPCGAMGTWTARGAAGPTPSTPRCQRSPRRRRTKLSAVE
jgi:acetyl esterase/lipase